MSERPAADLVIGVLDPHRPEVAVLLRESDEYLLSRYPPDLCFLDDASALDQPHVRLLGAWLGDELAGMGAAKIIRGDEAECYGEIKRVFVRAAARGRGLGKRIVQALEAHLLHKGVALARLETGPRQPEALALYRQLGYQERGPYGGYPDNPMSIFMEKRLGAALPVLGC